MKWLQVLIILYVPMSFFIGSILAHFVMNKRKLLGKYLMGIELTQKEKYRGIIKNLLIIIGIFIILSIIIKLNITLQGKYIAVGTSILINMYVYWYLVRYIILLDGISRVKSKIYILFYKINKSEYSLYKQKEIENNRSVEDKVKDKNKYNEYNKFN